MTTKCTFRRGNASSVHFLHFVEKFSVLFMVHFMDTIDIYLKRRTGKKTW